MCCPFPSLPNLEFVQDRILVQRRSRPLTLFLHSVAARRLTYKGIVRNFAQRGAPIVLWRGFSASVLRFRLAFSKPRTARRLPLLLSLCALVARGVRTDVGQLIHGGRCCGGAEGPCVGFTFVELQNICSLICAGVFPPSVPSVSPHIPTFALFFALQSLIHMRVYTMSSQPCCSIT